MNSDMLFAREEFRGMRVMLSEHLTQDGTPYTVKRTWRERLFSRPWQPLVPRRTVVPRIPYQGFYSLESGTLLMHPDTWRRIKEINGYSNRESGASASDGKDPRRA